MLFKLSCICLFAALTVAAQDSASPEIFRAQQTINTLRAQQAAGLVPRQKLEEAEQRLADLQDAELLERLIKQPDLTEEQAATLQDAAQRRLDRAQAAVDKQQDLVKAGIAAANTVDPLVQEKDWAETQFKLAMSRTEMVHEIAEMARAEEQARETAAAAITVTPTAPEPTMVRYDGAGKFTATDFARVERAFEAQFHEQLPISANGQTAVHNALGFDHHNRVDVALTPDSAEGEWLRHYLEVTQIPYYAFRAAIPGKATGAHIHIGPPSVRL